MKKKKVKMSYKALQCTKIGKDVNEAVENLKIGTLERKPLKPNLVRIKIEASSLNFFDILQIQGKYQGKQ